VVMWELARLRFCLYASVLGEDVRRCQGGRNLTRRRQVSSASSRREDRPLFAVLGLGIRGGRGDGAALRGFLRRGDRSMGCFALVTATGREGYNGDGKKAADDKFLHSYCYSSF
jgi:hypothetical protein